MNSYKLFIIFLFVFFALPVVEVQSQKSAQHSTPAKFLHEPYAKKKCSSCHSSDKPSAADIKSDTPDLCYSCHKKHTGNFVHSPVSLGECLICHNAHGSDHQFFLNQEEQDTCYLCHEQLEEKMGNDQYLAHTPADDGCTVCHTPHASELNSSLLKKEMKLLCTECHLEVDISLPVDIEIMTYKHKPLETSKSCVHCHDPHANVSENHLLAKPMNLCLQCHNKAVIAYDGSPLMDIAKLLQTNHIHHGPIKKKDCSGCHSPHGSMYYRILLDKYPKEFYTDSFNSDDYRLCFTCHDSSLLQDKETTTLTNFRDGKTNLHYLHVNKAQKGRTCRTCHEVHASNNSYHIRDSVPFGKIKWPLQLKYEVYYIDNKSGKHAPPRIHPALNQGGLVLPATIGKFITINVIDSLTGEKIIL